MASSLLAFLLLASLFCNICAIPSFDEFQGRGDPLKGLLGRVAYNVSEADRRPDEHHPFIEPGPTDQRGPCPGLNALANHGYLPRNGIVTANQAINASNWVFNMGTDAATVLSALQVAFSGNVETETFSIGGEDARTYSKTGIGSRAAGRQWGGDAHGRVEVDNSPTREDFNLNRGDTNTGIGSRFRRFVDLAKQTDNQFNMTTVNKLFAANIDLSIANNPKFTLDAFELIGNLAAYALMGTLYPNGTMGYGGTANYESISTLLGFKMNKNGDFCYVPERIPPNWYRKSTPFGFATGLLTTIPVTYNSNPYLKNDFGTYLSNASRSAELVCAQFKSIMNSIPSALQGTPPARINAAGDYLWNKLVLGLKVDETFGCTSPRPAANETNLFPVPIFDEKLQIQGQKRRYDVCS